MPLICRELVASILTFAMLFAPAYPRAQEAGSAPAPAGSAGAAAGEVPGHADLDTYPSELQPAIERFASDLRSIERRHPLAISPARTARLKAFYTDWLASLGPWEFEKLSLEGKVDYVLFRNELEYELRELEVKQKQYAEMEPLLPFAKTIEQFDDQRRRMEPVDAKQSAELVAQIKKSVEETRKAVALGLKPEAKPEAAPASGKKGPESAKPEEKPAGPQPEKKIEPIHTQKTVANRAVGALAELRKAFKSWYIFSNGYDPVFTWWVDQPYKEADKALEDYGVFLREQVLGVKADDKEAIFGDPIGREALLLELAHEMIPYTPEELLALARTEMSWCDAEMIKASRELGYGDDWHRALEQVKSHTVDPGKQPEMIYKLAEDAIAFVDERQLVAPFFLGGEDIMVSYPTDTMTEEQKLMSMRGNNYGFAHATVFHELIPGHHLQFFMLQRYRPYRRVFRTPFWLEGWALYCELMFWDMGFDRTPEEKIGALFWRMHRCARIIFSLSFHLGKMTPQECIDFLVERVGHERENAAAEVRRSFGGEYSPLYQAGYLVGWFQFRALHREMVESGKMANREMHDAIMRENTMAVEMVRALLTGQAPAKDFKTTWKFYGDVSP